MTRLGAGASRDHPCLEIEVRRGAEVESLHRVHAVLCDADGASLETWGDPKRLVFPRSAAKPIQVLPIVESDAAAAFGFGPAEIALACASHGGQPVHIAAVDAWLGRCGFGEGELECGAHPPLHAPSARAMWAAGRTPGAIYNTCSGQPGFGLALKVEDGATRAADVALAALLHRLQAPVAGIESLVEAVISDQQGVVVGKICAAAGR